MFPQPQQDAYFDGFNERLLAAVPNSARTIVEFGCSRGRLGFELKQQAPERRVIGVERDPSAASAARRRLDDVFELDLESEAIPSELGPIDCALFGDVLEHLRDPEAVLRGVHPLLADGGIVLASIPNIGHHHTLVGLLRADWMYEPQGLLDGTHLRFFTQATISKLFLDAGFLPAVCDVISFPLDDETLASASPLLRRYRVHPDRARAHLGAYQFVVRGTPMPVSEGRFASTPISFVVSVNDDLQFEWNLRRSPCLEPGSPHELIVVRDHPSAAAGFNAAMRGAKHDLVVFVHQDVYLPRGWDARFVEQFAIAERRYGPIGMAGVFGLTFRGGDVRHAGRIVDRDQLLEQAEPLPALVDVIDEVVVAIRRDSPLRMDPQLGFHLYGVDLGLAARERGLPAAVLDAPCFHNSLFAVTDAAFDASKDALLAKWPHIRPLWSNMGRLDTMSSSPASSDWELDLLEEVSRLRAELDLAGRRLAEADTRMSAMRASIFWRARAVAHRLTRFRSPVDH